MRRPKLARDTVWLASSDGLAIIFGLIGQVILAKALLQSDYGLMVVILDAFATPTNCRLPTVRLSNQPQPDTAALPSGYGTTLVQLYRFTHTHDSDVSTASFQKLSSRELPDGGCTGCHGVQ